MLAILVKDEKARFRTLSDAQQHSSLSFSQVRFDHAVSAGVNLIAQLYLHQPSLSSQRQHLPSMQQLGSPTLPGPQPRLKPS